ncbi:hypothetical protein F4777DRAFT_289040 [Nemania sp. FL0916]|nr:hypothetical protein F4777DRAFT_289040 [Nemania sp. FL0916]
MAEAAEDQHFDEEIADELFNVNLNEQAVPGVRMSRGLQYWFELWHGRYNFIVHRGEDVQPAQAHEYPEEFVTDEARPAPFPFGLSETWYCAILVALILAYRDGTDKGWLDEYVYPYLPLVKLVLGRALVTTVVSVLSTLAFEIFGGALGQNFLWKTTQLHDWISVILIRRFGFGEVDEDGEPMWADGDFVWIRDDTYRRTAIRDTLHGMATLAADYLAVFPLRVLNHLMTLWETHAGLSWLTDNSRLSLPTPSSDNIQDTRTLLLEFGVPILMQFCILVLLCLLRILYMAKAERLAMRGWRVIDPKMTIVWHLIRATATHLTAYTAYQIVCGIIVAMKLALPQRSRLLTIVDGPIVPFLGRILPEGRIVAAALIFFFHWLIRRASSVCVRFARPFWIPYILWQTRYSVVGAVRYWRAFVEVLDNDLSLDIFDPTKRVISRAAMTALFGLRSSWPAKLNLSSIVDVD